MVVPLRGQPPTKTGSGAGVRGSDRSLASIRGSYSWPEMAEMGRKEALARLEMSEDRVFALTHRVATLEARERDLQELVIAHRERVARLETERGFLKAEVTRLTEVEAGRADQLEKELASVRKQLEGLRSSRSYRMMQGLWRFRAALARPFRRRAKAAEVEGGKAQATTAAPRPAPPESAAQPPAAPPPAAGPTVGDREHERWLANAAQGPIDTRELRVAAIVDEISRACFEPDCDLVTFGPDGWRQSLEEAPPHLLLVESTWQGNEGSWQYQVASYDHPEYAGLPKLRALVGWCRERGIPTVFWNKEDPVHFDRFKEAAALFDHVFTTDANRVAAYGELDREGTGVVEALRFAAQPRIHNPIATGERRSGSPVFAGAYYRDRHEDRRRSLEMLLDAARPFDLVIYDRTAGSTDQAFGFPDRFRPYIRGRLPYVEMLEAYKAHKVFLNANSVTDSPTMFSRRVFELLACDTAVVSTESLGVAETFGELVSIVETPEQATEALRRLLEDDEYRRDLVVRGRRLVLGEHTYAHRLAAIAQAAGYPAAPYGDRQAAAVVLVEGIEDARAVGTLVSAISSQTRPPAELLIGLGTETSVAGDLQELSDGSSDLRVRVVQQDPGASRSQRYRELAALAVSPWVAVMNPRHEYGPDHLGDLLIATRYAEADVIGSAPAEQRFTEFVHPHSALARRELIADRGWPDEMPASWAALEGWFREGVRFFSGGAGGFKADPALGEPPRPSTSAESADAG
jgi:Glycosyl transferases group 1